MYIRNLPVQIKMIIKFYPSILKKNNEFVNVYNFSKINVQKTEKLFLN